MLLVIAGNLSFIFKTCKYLCFSESDLLEWNWSTELFFFFFLGRRFFHNFQLFELMILKNGLHVQFCIFALLLFWCNSTHSDFSYTQKCCGSFPFGNLLKVVRFQTEEWHVLYTGHIWILQISLHRTVGSEVEIFGVILRILSISLFTEEGEQLMLILSADPFHISNLVK